MCAGGARGQWASSGIVMGFPYFDRSVIDMARQTAGTEPPIESSND
jgi:hypothetical protein